MRKTIILLGLLAIALGVYWFLDSDKEDEKIAAIKADRNFAVEEDDIYKVVITQKNGKVNTLIKGKEYWTMNGQRMNQNQEFLVQEALTRIRMESIPPKGAYKAIMDGMARLGILVKVYDKGEQLLRSYYVGGVPQGERGTYYLMEGSNQPYLMQIPGMEGSMRGRFVKKDTDWLDRAMFRYPDKNINYISVEYPRAKNRSFELVKKGADIEINPLFPFTPVINEEKNERLIEDYLQNYYKGFFTEAYENEHPLRDSIVNYMVPFAKISIIDNQQDITSLDLYPYNEIYQLKSETATGPEVGKMVERYYVNVNDGERFMLTQHILAKKFLWAYDYFYR